MNEINDILIKKRARIFKALSNEQRLKLFLMIYQGFSEFEDKSKKKEGSNCGVLKAFSSACECLNLSKSTISHHFKELQNAGLITCTRQGQSYFCEVNQDAVNNIREFLT